MTERRTDPEWKEAVSFVPPVAENLPEGALDCATAGADDIDVWALSPEGRNFLAHALVRMNEEGWLKEKPE